jgi:hypothetical protein
LHLTAELAAGYCTWRQLSVRLALAATVLAVCWRRSQLERNSLLEPGRQQLQARLSARSQVDLRHWLRARVQRLSLSSLVEAVLVRLPVALLARACSRQ